MSGFNHMPYSWLDDVRRDFSRLVNTEQVQQWSPAVDLAEDDNGYFIAMDLPGVKPEDVEITTHSRKLSIKGRRQASESERKLLSRERWCGDFERRFVLPKSADADHIDAKYSNGVLTVYLPKVKDAEPRRIEISVH